MMEYWQETMMELLKPAAIEEGEIEILFEEEAKEEWTSEMLNY